MQLWVGFRSGLARVADLTNRMAILICQVSVVLMTVSILLQVFRRYVMNAALIWPEELALFFMVWLTFLGASVALRRGDHVAVNLLTSRLGPRLGALVSTVNLILILLLSAVLTYTAWRVAWLNRETLSDAMQVSLFWPKLGIAVGSMCMAIQALHLLVQRTAGQRGGRV